MKTIPRSRTRPVPRQRGVALLVVLVLLLIMTLLGLASLRGALMEERMGAATLDRGLAFQAAEAALREAEAIVATRPTYPANGCLNGLCSRPNDTNLDGIADNPLYVDRWLDTTFAGWRNSTVDFGATPVGGAPQFIIETMGDAPNWPGCDRELPVNPTCLSPRYRVTARAATTADRAQVLLQSNVSTP